MRPGNVVSNTIEPAAKLVAEPSAARIDKLGFLIMRLQTPCMAEERLNVRYRPGWRK
jgi:hypothetical protein